MFAPNELPTSIESIIYNLSLQVHHQATLSVNAPLLVEVRKKFKTYFLNKTSNNQTFTILFTSLLYCRQVYLDLHRQGAQKQHKKNPMECYSYEL